MSAVIKDLNVVNGNYLAGLRDNDIVNMFLFGNSEFPSQMYYCLRWLRPISLPDLLADHTTSSRLADFKKSLLYLIKDGFFLHNIFILCPNIIKSDVVLTDHCQI